jgi:hypothetical protein
MVGRAKSKEDKRREYVSVKEKWMERAVEAYQSQDNGDQDQNNSERKGMLQICMEMSKRCWEEENVEIHLNKQTLSQHLHGIQNQAKSNEEKGWLSEEEEHVIVDLAVSVVNQSFPLSQKCIQEHAEELCRAHHGSSFKGLENCG